MKLFIQIGAAYGALGVALGAFGTHALKASLVASARMDTFEIAVKYQFYHALALLLLGLLISKSGVASTKWLTWAGYAFTLGILIFSGSLYAICFTGITKFGASAPIGGLLLLAGWILLFMGASKFTKETLTA